MASYFDDYDYVSGSNKSKSGILLPSVHRLQDPEKILYIQKRISELYKLDYIRKYNPAPNPISIDCSSLNIIKNQNYVVAEKTDGIRFLLLLDTWPSKFKRQPCAIMCTRKYEMFEIRVVAEELYFRGTLIDGELTWHYEDHSICRQLYLAFDLIAIKGDYIGNWDYIQRWTLLNKILDIHNEDMIKDPRKWFTKCQELAEDHKIVCEGNQFCLNFRIKQIFPLDRIETIWRLKNSMGHKIDGLIFTPVNEFVKIGTNDKTFKWKTNHTIDVEWTGQYHSHTKEWIYEIFFYNRNMRCSGSIDGIIIRKPLYLEDSNIILQDSKQDTLETYPYEEVPLIYVPSIYSQKIVSWHFKRGTLQFSHIVECACKLPLNTEWIGGVPMVECTVKKIRYDKIRSNDKLTIERTLHNIRENITIRNLTEYLKTDSPQI